MAWNYVRNRTVDGGDFNLISFIFLTFFCFLFSIEFTMSVYLFVSFC